jgi:hypothetical protein
MNVKQAVGVSVLLGLALTASAGPDMNPGRPAGVAPALPPGTVPMGTAAGSASVQPAADEPVTPLAITLFEWGIPFSRGWDVYGIRVNTCFPGWTSGHNDVYGIDFGLSGEVTGDAAGISCNLFDNSCGDFGGIQIGGFYNRIKGDAPIALQTTLIHNRANAMNGIQIGGIWNVAAVIRGIQIGLINYAENGAALQIGLWNQSGTHGSPLLGVVF